jgi:hypothetical protein
MNGEFHDKAMDDLVAATRHVAYGYPDELPNCDFEVCGEDMKELREALALFESPNTEEHNAKIKACHTGQMDPEGEWCKFVEAEDAIVEAYEKGIKKGQDIKFEISTAEARAQGREQGIFEATDKARKQGAQEEREEVVRRLEKWRHSNTDHRSMDDVILARGEGKTDECPECHMVGGHWQHCTNGKIPVCTCPDWPTNKFDFHYSDCPCYKPAEKPTEWWEKELPDNPRKIARLGHIDSGDIWDIQARLNELIDRENSRA